MEIPNSMASDSAYIETKKAELKEFFKDAKFPQSVIDKAIENELKPLTQGVNVERPYIAASASGTLKSEYEVMTGQPFTNVEDHNKPLTTEEIKHILKDSPIIVEKARQIQIVINQESQKDIAVPLDKINLSNYDDIQTDIKSADGDIKKQNTIKYKNMQVLMNAAAEYRSKSQIYKSPVVTEETVSEETDSSDEKEFEAIDKVVTECTNKSYETRYLETKEMLQQLADKHEDPNAKVRECRKLEIENNPILKESSYCLVKPPKGQSSFDGIKESYAINDALNIPLKDNPINLDLSGKIKKNLGPDKSKSNNENVEEMLPNSFEVKLKDTEKVLSKINCILSKDDLNTNKNNNNAPESLSSKSEDINQVQPLNETSNIVAISNQKVKYDDKMEETLHNALENIFEITKTETTENNELEFKEMKNLARNIVEGAENLSTLIKEDITNKLNSMNELLNDVNEALENSRKSSLAYKKLKEEGEAQKRLRTKAQDNVHENINSSDKEQKTVSQLEIDDIHTAINKLNAEIKCHESRVNTSKANYETRNQDCKDFIKELDGVLEKSHSILHPKSTTSTLHDIISTSVEEVIPDDVNKEKVERNKKIDRLLYDIKDKMKGNKEVLRLANNLLRREENKTDSTIKTISADRTDDKAKGDYARHHDKLEKIEDQDRTSVPSPVEEVTGIFNIIKKLDKYLSHKGLFLLLILALRL